jgi:MFS family permease
VVVAVLPAVMAGIGIPIQQLDRATPILSGYLIGYLIGLPLIGRVSDRYGRSTPYLWCLALFAMGSAMTASSHGLGAVTAGRVLQGLGGGGLVPLAIALVADGWDASERTVPLGVVTGLQELGSVLGPLYGALIVIAVGWRPIFWLNLPLAAICWLGFFRSGGASARAGRADKLALGLVAAGLASLVLAMSPPAVLADSVALGVIYQPLLHGNWSAPIALAPILFFLAAVLSQLRQRATLAPLRSLPAFASEVDLIGAGLAGAGLAMVVVAFASANPNQAVISATSYGWLAAGALMIGLLGPWERRHPDPLVAPSMFKGRRTVGALFSSLLIGGALIAALLDIPLFAEVTADHGSTPLTGAVQLVRFLVAVPLGAVAGGWLCRRGPYRVVAGAGLAMASASLAIMSRWPLGIFSQHLVGLSSLSPADPALVACGLGFGLAIAPVNAVILEATPSERHGLAAALVVVARTVGMVVGLAVLTDIGLHDFAASVARIRPSQLCHSAVASCARYQTALGQAALVEFHAVFLGASIMALVAAAASALLFDRSAVSQEGTGPARSLGRQLDQEHRS